MNPAEEKPTVFEREYFLTPAECTPERRMPLTLLINRLIEVATLHADSLGIGYTTLSKHSQTWVLSRVAVEMKLYPGVRDHYTIRTWVSSVSRLFSERDFEICDSRGEVIGHARTVWAALNVDTRTAGDISYLSFVSEYIPGKESPVAKPSRPMVLKDYEVAGTYRFKYTDIDFNRHVNSSRYIELLLNQWPLGFHDRYRLTRFEIAYLHEACFDDEVEVRLHDSDGEVRAELVNGDRALCRAMFRYTPREPENMESYKV